MDFFDKFFGYKELSDKRINQIRMEKNIDYQLDKMYSSCPEIIFNYLTNIRRLNREMFVKTYSVSIFKFSEKTIENMDVMDNIYSQIDLKNVCETLPNAIREIKRR
jgi:hypothetical protein